MSIESDDDRLALLMTLGESVKYNSRDIYGIFEMDYTQIDIDRPVESATPMLMVRTIDAPNARHDDAVYRQGKPYRVVSVQPDGDGMTTLVMVEA